MKLKIKNDIDHSFIDRAEEEAFQILLNQNLSFSARWNSKVRPILRKLGMLLSLFGMMFSIFVIASIGPEFRASVCLDSSMAKLMWYALFCAVLFFIFYFLPNSKDYRPSWSKKLAIKTCQRSARQCVKNAKSAAPFEAEYEVNGDSISYYRWKDNIRELVWTKKFKGIAIHGTLVTLFFNKWTSVSPIMVILHQNFDEFEPVLEQQKIESKTIV